jgi:hypothetical protein
MRIEKHFRAFSFVDFLLIINKFEIVPAGRIFLGTEFLNVIQFTDLLASSRPSFLSPSFKLEALFLPFK